MTIDLSLPKGSTVRGQILEKPTLNDLDSDFYGVGLPSGVFIDVGWYPQYVMSGSFIVSIYRDDISKPIVTPYHTKEISDVVRVVTKAVDEYGVEKIYKPAVGNTSFALINQISKEYLEIVRTTRKWQPISPIFTGAVHG